MVLVLQLNVMVTNTSAKFESKSLRSFWDIRLQNSKGGIILHKYISINGLGLEPCTMIEHTCARFQSNNLVVSEQKQIH